MQTELHFHLLPDVDDGPRDDEEAVELARLAVAEGTSRIVVTPHARLVDVEALPLLTARLDEVLRGSGVELELRYGAELSPQDVGSLDHDELEIIAQGPPGARWTLLEAPLVAGDVSLEAAANELRRRGFGVLIGHPERSFVTPPATVHELVALGAVVQINASSVTGGHGPEARAAALSLARSRLPFVLASDAHSPSRPPMLTAAASQLLAAGIDGAAVRAAIDALPAAILRHGLGVAHRGAAHGPHGARLRLGQRERAAVRVARATQVFFDRRRGS